MLRARGGMHKPGLTGVRVRVRVFNLLIAVGSVLSSVTALPFVSQTEKFGRIPPLI